MLQSVGWQRIGYSWATEQQQQHGKNGSSIHEIVKKEKEICASFAVAKVLQCFTQLLYYYSILT